MRSSQLSGLLWCCNSEGLANSVLGAGREPRLAASAVEDDAAFIPALDEAGLRKVPPWEKFAYLRREGGLVWRNVSAWERKAFSSREVPQRLPR